MKKLARSLIAAILGYQVRRLCRKNQIKVIGVVGSIGKTSTKLAIAKVLKSNFKVQFQEGNYNDLVSVPLVFFGQELPNLYSPSAWLRVLRRNQQLLKQTYPFDVVVIELGSDGPGQIHKFKKFLKLEIAVVTGITPEHMAFFKNLDAVAKEELAVRGFSSLVLANQDLCDQKYLTAVPELLTYGIEQAADYRLIANEDKIAIQAGKELVLDAKNQPFSRAQLYSVLAASTVAYKLGMEPTQIKQAIGNITPVPGRMQTLAGINGSTILDDSYNASPQAMKLALDTLYEMKALQKIAVLGNMNELGSYSEAAHAEVGGYCDPKQLDLVVTIGTDANKYLAAAAEAKGCKVKQFDSPYKIGEYLKPLIEKNGLVLVKGSQNGVFAEEAIKPLLANPTDETKLVRQSADWLKIKQEAFNR